MQITIILVLGTILALAATILGFVFIIPEKKRPNLNGFGKFLHDFLNFKFLIIEKIIQFCYVLATSFCLIGGFFMLFWFEERYQFGYYMESGFGGYNEVTKEWVGYYGLLVMILGPIVLRLVYELIMLAIIAVKNIIQINNKIKNPEAVESKSAPAPVVPAATVAPTANFCVKCGAPIGPDGNCQNPDCK